MKAWIVREKDEFYATVVFAETRGKAKSIALTTDCCEGVDFCNVEVRRAPQMDKYYKNGKTEMHWDLPQDRIALVKDCDFFCCDDAYSEEECKVCAAKPYCNRFALTKGV